MIWRLRVPRLFSNLSAENDKVRIGFHSLSIFFPLSPPASLCRIQKLNQILRSDFLLPLLLPFGNIRGLSIGVHSGFNPHPVSVFFLPHDGDISSFVHLLPPNSTVDKNAPSPLVVFCANSNANANATVNNVLFVAAFKSIRSIPYLLNDCSFSLPLGCARSDTTFHADSPSSSKLSAIS